MGKQLLILFVFFISVGNAQTVSLSISLPDSIRKEDLDSTYMTVCCTNHTADTINIRDPELWTPERVTWKGKPLYSTIKVNPAIGIVYRKKKPKIKDSKVRLFLPEQQECYSHTTSMGHLGYAFEKGNTYKIKIEYSGLFFIKEEYAGEISTESNEIEFRVY